MKGKLRNYFFPLLMLTLAFGACDSDKEEQKAEPATDLVVDNKTVTLLQGDEITVNVTSGNGNYSVKSFDESIATASVDGEQVTIKAAENSTLGENNQTETTILVIDSRKKVAKVLVKVAKL